MKSREEILRTLDDLKGVLKKRYKVKKIGLFGSFVRADQSPGSDVDILVSFDEGADLLDLVGLGLFLEERLGQKVDVVPEAALKLELRESVLKQVAYV
ncbi:nucleotidyltransferase domain protein [archaeon BMS3Abin16]|nr:nucleotidyltransferase domain protein [archaeon BMS3Abin16]